jgi:CheY-like chemotaxis protein
MRTIFLIDDDADDREIFQSALDDIAPEFQCYEAKDGQEALDMIASNSLTFPDIIFVDLNMPKVNGLEFLTEIKKKSRYQEIPVIMYSTSSVKEEKEKCISHGASGFMTKHGSYDELCRELKKIITEFVG